MNREQLTAAGYVVPNGYAGKHFVERASDTWTACSRAVLPAHEITTASVEVTCSACARVLWKGVPMRGWPRGGAS